MAVVVKSYQQIVGQMLRRLMAVTGLSDTQKASFFLTICEAAAQNDYEQLATILQLLDDASVDSATGAELVKLAIARGLAGRNPSTYASGYVNISDSTITKVSTFIYVGANPPLAGDLTIKVNSSTGIAALDSVYVGRGTANEEGPIAVASISVGATFSTITLSTPLTKNHNGNESVIKAQGGTRTIAKGTKVVIPANNVSEQFTFTVQTASSIADGESIVQNVLVRADKPGVAGNAGLGTIKSFTSNPFSGATVTNASSFSNASDLESDDDLRGRIKQHVQSLSKGVDAAIKLGVLGAFDDEDNKRVVSVSLVEPTTSDESAKLYIDDGTGFEPSFEGSGAETLVETAAGSEQFLQIGSYPIVKAQLVSTKAEPYDFTVGGTLTVKVNGVAETIAFSPSDFDVIDAGTAIEVVNVINDRASKVSARTSDTQSTVVIFSRGEDDDRMQVVSGGVNDTLGFSTQEAFTMRLYKNDVLLSHDGATATVESADYDTWSLAEMSIIVVDVNDKPRQWIRVGSGSLEVSYSGAPGSYVALSNITTFLSLGTTIQTASVANWVTVLNQAVQGAVFSANQDRLVLTSLLTKSAASKVRVVPDSITLTPTATSIVSGQGWSTEQNVGRASDYELNRFSGQLELATPLVAADRLEVGSSNTRAFLKSAIVTGGFYDFAVVSGRSASIFVVVDGAVALKPVTITPSFTTITCSRPGASTTIRYTANAAIFGTAATPVVVGDYIALGRQEAALHEGIFRVTAVDAAFTWVEVVNSGVTVNPAGTATTQLSGNEISVFSSTKPPQKVTFANSALTTPTSTATQFNEQVTGATASAESTRIKILSNSYDEDGSIVVPASFEWASTKRLDFVRTTAESVAPHVATVESESELTFPIALGKGSVTTAAALNITDSARTSGTPGGDSQWVKWLSGNNKGVRGFVQSWDVATPTVLTMRDSTYTALGSARVVAPDALHQTTIGDLYQQFKTFEFGQDDSLAVVVDGDAVAKTYTIPLYRNGRCTSAGAASISGLDIDGAAASTFAGTFWSTYDFTDYKVWFKAHRVVNPTGVNNAFIVRSKNYGPIGEKTRFFVDYPTAPSAVATITTTPSLANIDVKLRMPSGAARSPAWDATTRFDITLGAGTIIYTYDGTGTAPNFVAQGVVVGDIVTTNSLNFNAANNGTFYVSAVTATVLTVLGTGFAENDKTLGVSTALRVYPLSGNTGTAMVAKINESTIVEAVLATSNDGTGTIAQSTLDDTGITVDTAGWITLVDGENFVSSYSNPGAPSFNLKNNLTELSVTDYNFGTAPNVGGTTGEVFRLIPVTARHLTDWLNKKGVTSLSMSALIQRSDEGDRVQIASLSVGSAGAVQVTGGAANATSALITKAGSVDGTGSKVTMVASQASFIPGATALVKNAYVAPCVNTYDSQSAVTISLPGVYGGIAAKVEMQNRPTFNLIGASFSVTANVDGTATYTRTAGTGTLSTAVAGDELYVDSDGGSPAFNAANRGSFPVVSSTANTIIVVNPLAVTQAGPIAVAAGEMVAVTPLFYHPKGPVTGCVLAVDRLNSRFSRLRYVSGTAPLFSKNGVLADHFVDIGSPFLAANSGRFRVVAVDDTSIIVANSAAVDEQQTCVSEIVDATTGEITGGTIRFWGPNSAISGGSVAIDSLTAANWFTVGNFGTHTIIGVGRNPASGGDPGRQFVYVKRATTMLAESLTLAANLSSFRILEAAKFESYRQIENVCVNPNNSNEAFVWVSGNTNSDRLSATNGTTLQATNKLGYSTTKVVGADGYAYWTGLLRKVHRIVDGYDPDRVTYPGIRATGARIEVLPPIIQRVKISVDVRTVSGLSVAALSDTIKSTILSYISGLGVGEDVIASEIVKRVQAVPGVESITMLEPSSSTERIAIQDNEKAVAFESDVAVT